VVLLAFVVLPGTFAYSLDPFRSLRHYRLDTWTTEQGLPHNSVNSILQTDDGFLWIATFRGIVRFDGVEFQRISIPQDISGHVRNYLALLQTPDKSVWVATEGAGLLRVTSDSVESFDPAHGFEDNVVDCLALDSSNALWVGTLSQGVYRLTPPYAIAQAGHVTTRDGLPSNEIRDLCVDKAGSVWATTWNGLLARLSSSGSHSIKTVPLPPDQKAFYLFGRSDGSLLVSATGGIYQCEHETFSLVIPTPIPGSDFFVALGEDRDGNIWAGSYLSGLVRRTPPAAGGTLSTYTKKMGLAGNYISDVCEDNEGSLWIGTEVGLNRLSDGSFVTLYDEDGFTDESATCLAETGDGTVWSGTDGGGLLKIRDGKVAERFQKTSGFRNLFISAMTVDHAGRLLVSTEDSCTYVFREGQGASLLFKTKSIVRALIDDNHGSLWCATGNGILRFSPRTSDKITPAFLKDGIAGNCLLANGREGIWAGTRDGLVELHDTVATVYRRADGLPSSYITCLTRDTDGTVWIGTPEGIARRIGHRFEAFDTRQGLPDQYVTSITPDGRGFLWLGTPSGVYRIARSAFDSVDAGVQRRVVALAFGETDGMKSSECSEGDAVTLRSRRTGVLWFSTTRGIAVVDPANLRIRRRLAPLQVEQVTVSPDKILHRGPFELNAGENNFTVQYTLPAFLGQNRLRFQYRLEGFDQGWIDAGNRRFATYTNVPPGEYRFAVRTTGDTPGSSTAVMTSVAISIAPHLYERRGFYFGLALLMVAGLGISHIIRVRRADERERRLAKMVDDRTMALRESEAHRQAILQVMPLVLYTARTPDDFGATWITDNTMEVTGFPPNRFLVEKAFWVSRVHPDDLKRVQTYLEMIRDGKAGDIEYRWQCADGSYHWFLDHTVRLEEREDGRVEYSGVWFDITDKIDAEEQLRTSLHEKEALLREVHHRVKNNLTVITSLLSLQASSLEDTKHREVLREAEGRVRSMATLHEHLYKSHDLGAVDLQSYISALVRTLSRTYGKPGVEILTNVEGVTLDIAHAIPCGLIVNELVTNCMKYAFPDDRHGMVHVTLQQPSPHHFLLEVKDDGVGFAVPSDLENSPTLGLKLVAILGRQLDGIVTLVSGQGTQCSIAFQGIPHAVDRAPAHT
jgi:PAS domain S-box-containing protein